MLAELKRINWQRQANTAIKILLDVKILGLIALNGLMIYGIGWDTVLRPSLENIKGRDAALTEQKKSFSEKEGLQKQYGVWEQQLKNLETQMILIPEGNSSKVISVTESSELLELAQGKLRDIAILPPLPSPHDERLNVSLTPGASTVIDIMKLEGATDASATPAEQGGANPNAPPDAIAPGSGSQSGIGAATSIPIERFDYDLKVTGTYSALVDVLNELTIRKKLIKINKITITATAAEAEAQPDAKDYPEYPIKLEMLVSLSIFLYTANGQPS